jgi:hypothetical protein
VLAHAQVMELLELTLVGFRRGLILGNSVGCARSPGHVDGYDRFWAC